MLLFLHKGKRRYTKSYFPVLSPRKALPGRRGTDAYFSGAQTGLGALKRRGIFLVFFQQLSRKSLAWVQMVGGGATPQSCSFCSGAVCPSFLPRMFCGASRHCSSAALGRLTGAACWPNGGTAADEAHAHWPERLDGGTCRLKRGAAGRSGAHAH